MQSNGRCSMSLLVQVLGQTDAGTKSHNCAEESVLGSIDLFAHCDINILFNVR